MKNPLRLTRLWFDVVGFWTADFVKAKPEFVGANRTLFVSVPPERALIAADLEEEGTQAVLVSCLNEHLAGGELPIRRVRVLPQRRPPRNPWSSSGIIRKWRRAA